MALTLDDYLERSKRADSPEVSAARAVFDQAYGIAREVIELREKHHLTQVELAAKAGLPQAQISRTERPSSLAYPSVDALAQQVGVPAVTGILLDPVHHQLPNCDPVLRQTLAQIRVLGQRGVGRGLLARQS
jgi:hypothetical protein